MNTVEQGETDEAYEGSYTIKQYRSFKHYDADGSWYHENALTGYRPSQPQSLFRRRFAALLLAITLDPDSSDDFRIIGELVEVLG